MIASEVIVFTAILQPSGYERAVFVGIVVISSDLDPAITEFSIAAKVERPASERQNTCRLCSVTLDVAPVGA